MLTFASCLPGVEQLTVDLMRVSSKLPAEHHHLSSFALCALAKACPRLVCLDLDSVFDGRQVAVERGDTHDAIGSLARYCTSLVYIDVMHCGFSERDLSTLARLCSTLLSIEAHEARSLQPIFDERIDEVRRVRKDQRMREAALGGLVTAMAL